MNALYRFKEYLVRPNNEALTISVKKRFLLLPISMTWFLLQTLLGLIAYPIFIMLCLIGIVLSLYLDRTLYYMKRSTVWLIAPIISPIVWFYRYFRFGEFGAISLNFLDEVFLP